MIGVYFSGTGNTAHCIQEMIKRLDSTAKNFSIEDENVTDSITREDFIVFGYPIQFSNIPVIVRDFIRRNHKLWKGKQILCVSTMGAFSGDGSGCAARLFKRYGANVAGGLHIKMPDSIGDKKSFIKSEKENREIIFAAHQKIEQVCHMIQSGKYPREGLSFFAHLAGLFGQRLWLYGKTGKYSDMLKINQGCVGCGLCEKVCPMKNIDIVSGRAKAKNHCTMCYRCISLCPQKAITLLGKEVIEQVRYEKY